MSKNFWDYARTNYMRESLGSAWGVSHGNGYRYSDYTQKLYSDQVTIDTDRDNPYKDDIEKIRNEKNIVDEQPKKHKRRIIRNDEVIKEVDK